MSESYVDLAPAIYRQRLVVEGIPEMTITAEVISDYLRDLGPVLQMIVLTEPVTHLSIKFGWSGWSHWSTSGVHMYSWDKEPRADSFPFVSVDIYTCKAFDPQVAFEFTRERLQLAVATMKEF
ncbi:MAG: S-adenosylmethionine decarboxylase [Candidatus Nanopelagicales bacterium]